MNPGKLDKLFTVQRDTGTTKNTRGEHVESWSTYKTFWGSFKYDAGLEDHQSDQLVAVKTITILCRYDSTITAKMRILYNLEYYDIVGIQPLDGRMYMNIKCFIRDNG